ncbi:MAG: hypothetical protein EBY43_08745 [Opitutae bacterium]|nr:hypothetical protein [Opitutae bacterium]NDH17653.1 hypothetical protein [Opitutae bacterium]
MHGDCIDALRKMGRINDAFERNKSTVGDLRPLNLQKKLEINEHCAKEDRLCMEGTSTMSQPTSGMQYNLQNERNLHSGLETNILSELQDWYVTE